MTQKRIDDIVILMAVFNGAQYLTTQMNSIISQSINNWTMIIRDDHSTDHSMKIIQSYLKEKIILQKNYQGRLGAAKNFFNLITYHKKTAYCAFADQDDVWHPEKMTKQMMCMQKIESDTPIPILIHTDMSVVDQFLNEINPSFMRYMHMHHESNNALQVLLTQNFVTGCTVLMNRPLLNMVLPIPKEAVMHDWWVALCAATFGKIEYIDEPLVQYRQHNHNTIGAQHIKNLLNPFKHNWYKKWQKGRKNLQQSISQAKALKERVQAYDPHHHHLSLINSYASILQLPSWKRIQKLQQLGIHAQSKLRHALLIAKILSLPKEKP